MNRLLFLEGKSRNEIKDGIDIVSPSMPIVKKGFNELQRDGISIFDNPLPDIM